MANTYADIVRKVDCRDGTHLLGLKDGIEACIFCGRPASQSPFIPRRIIDGPDRPTDGSAR